MRSYSDHSGLARRTFLGGLATGGVGMAAAQAAPPRPLAARLPDAMTRPGGADLPYGLPAVHEVQVERTLSTVAGFPVWRDKHTSPLRSCWALARPPMPRGRK